jgi:hypothetical protein
MNSPDDVTGEAITPEGLAHYIAELVADQDLVSFLYYRLDLMFTNCSEGI